MASGALADPADRFIRGWAGGKPGFAGVHARITLTGQKDSRPLNLASHHLASAWRYRQISP